MLTAALRIYRWDRRTSSISSDRLEADGLPALERGLAVYRASAGRARGDVRNAARTALDGLRPDRIDPVVKLLDDAATYEWPRAARSAERRVAVFEAAAERHPLLDRAAAVRILNDVLGSASDDLDVAVADLYADYPAFHRLVAFPRDYTADQLRADYDLAQAQALLYSATRVTVDAGADFKHVLRYARLARLLHQVEPLPSRGGPRVATSESRDAGQPGHKQPAPSGGRRGRRTPSRTTSAHASAGYRFILDGPSSVLRRTRAYGVDFARFLAALVRLRDWRLVAEIELRQGWRALEFRLGADDGLGAYRGAPPAFDSELEAAIARKFGTARDGWHLVREGAVVRAGDSLIVPDFAFRHEDGTEVLLEIAGYWTPEYVADKMAKLARVRGANVIVAVPKRLALRAGALPATVLPFARRLLLRDLLPRLEAFRR